jgi:hypothetical protein
MELTAKTSGQFNRAKKVLQPTPHFSAAVSCVQPRAFRNARNFFLKRVADEMSFAWHCACSIGK